MPNRRGVMHGRGASLSSITQAELTNFMQQFGTCLKSFLELYEKLNDNEPLKLGEKNEDEIEKFIYVNCY
jgi:hypothetical protein